MRIKHTHIYSIWWVCRTLVRSRILYSPSKPLSLIRFADTVEKSTQTIRLISKKTERSQTKTCQML